MDAIHIEGGAPLRGEVEISGAKNAALPLMAASLLTKETLSLANLPRLADIETMGRILANHGVDIGAGGPGRTLDLTCRAIADTTAPYDLVRKMRASVLVLGPLVARAGAARVSLPGGCAIGARPVDLHLRGLEALGAEITLDEGYVIARAPRGLKGGRITFPFVSVGATENLLMAATLAEGETVIENAAREPEIGDLAQCLSAMGARIDGVGGETLTVTGVPRLHGARHSVLPDRIETGTYAIAAAITDCELELLGARAEHLGAVVETLRAAGVEVTETARGLRVARAGRALTGVDVTTQPFPGFPTDLQAQMMALFTIAEGAARIDETIFENRFMHAPELMRMGADITIHGGSAMVRGVEKLTGAPVMATDLRASSSLVLAGLAAEGETIVARVYHIDRGYERIVGKLRAVGAQIERRRAS